MWAGAKVGGVRRRVWLWSPMLAYRRVGPPLGIAIARGAMHCKGGFQVAQARRWRPCARGKCIQRVANRIVMVVSWQLWVVVVGMRRCARGKCIQRVANRTVMVVSRVWVVGLWRCARGKCMQRVAMKSWS